MSVEYLTAYMSVYEALPLDIQTYLTQLREIDLELQQLSTAINATLGELDQANTTSSQLQTLQAQALSMRVLNERKGDLVSRVERVIASKNKAINSMQSDYKTGVYQKKHTAAVERALELRHKAMKREEKSRKSAQSAASGSTATAATTGGDAKPKKKPGKRKATSKSTTPTPPSTATPSSGPPPKAKKTERKKETKKEVAKKDPRKESSKKKTSSKDKREKKEKEQEPKFCLPTCKEQTGDMIGCDNDACRGEWFHYQCVGLTAPPKTRKWFCPMCRPSKKR
eukprot:m.233148 g.233148  ORF g.233148 m.233148 type:complete len:283 (+) comp15243_c1_seq2:249-1097(+)